MIAAVVPCYNEAERLDVPTLAAAVEERPDWMFVFVDDGSTDRTGELLEGLRSRHRRNTRVLRLRSNQGKGEAVRQGMLLALDEGAEIVAYIDADVSTPFHELDRLVGRLAASDEIDVVLGARVRRLGADIRRRAARHVLGRLYGTLASLALGVGVYDTQCGAKAFRSTPSLTGALSQPFGERWAFDVELLSRLTRGATGEGWSAIVEEPLYAWHDRSGSKLRPLAAAWAGVELLRIARRHRRRARSGRAG